MSVRLQISALVFLMVQAVLFGVGILAILYTPLSAQAQLAIPIMIAATVLISAPLSWAIAPRLRLRFQQRRHA